MKYIVKKTSGSILRRMVGSYIDSLPRLHKFASCIIEQQTDTEDEEHNSTTRIRIDPPKGKRPRKFRLRLFYVLLVYLFVSCAETPADGEKTMSIQDLETWQSCDPSDTSHQSDPSDPSTIDLESEWQAVSRLAHAFAVVESNDNPHAVNHQENAVGLLQIRPIMVKQANQIVGEDIYTLSDRHDSLTSIAIFHTVMSELNPTLDVDRAIDIWNPNASTEYRNLIKAIYYENTKISWTTKTWNPVTGCTKYSAGCANCYAEVITRRFKKYFPNGFNVTLHPERLDEPKHVTKPTTFFVCSMADLFHYDVPFEYIDRVMQTIRDCPQHTFQLLTKRTARMSEYFETRPVPKNCWIGTTVEKWDNTYRIDILSYITSYEPSVHFLSCEPLLSDLGTLDLAGIDWVIVGGEIGPKARPMKKEWVLNIKRQCDKQDVPFFFKSWGRYGEDGRPCPKDQHDLLDGVKYQAYPRRWEKGE